MLRRRRRSWTGTGLDQREATQEAKAHPDSITAYRKLERYMRRSHGTGVDPRVLLHTDDPKAYALSRAYRDTWTRIRSGVMGEAPGAPQQAQ